MKRTLISTACALALCATHATARDPRGITNPTVLQRGFGAEQSFDAGAPDRVWFDKDGTAVPAGSISAMQQRWDALKPNILMPHISLPRRSAGLTRRALNARCATSGALCRKRWAKPTV